jgi:hypothetical protein
VTQLNVSNGYYVLDQHSNYMFRPLEAIFRLHKVELGERDIIHIVCGHYIYILYPSLSALFVLPEDGL